MKHILMALGLAAASLHAAAAPDVGVSVTVGQPGFYGRVDIGQAPPAAVVYPQPIVVRPAPAIVAHRPPIYLRVPSGHTRDWRRYCGRYDACNQPVYFVRDDWYRDHYRHAAPPRHLHRALDHRRDDRRDWRDDRRDDRRDVRDDRGDRHDDRRGDRGHHGRGHGRD